MTLVVIGYDRYNVIVKGINGFKMSYTLAIPIVILVWIYSIATSVPPFFGWGGYALGRIFSDHSIADKEFKTIFTFRGSIGNMLL